MIQIDKVVKLIFAKNKNLIKLIFVSKFGNNVII